MIELKSNQTLFIEEGAVVYACIRARDAENIRILGHGILDNSHNKEKILFEVNLENNSEAVMNAKRLHTVQLEYCTNIEIDGITIRDSLLYNIRPIGCEKLKIKNVKAIGCWRYNSDGIDMHNCKDVYISNCFLRTFDDSICIKGFDYYFVDDIETAVRNATYRNGKVYDCFRNVLIENCVVWNDWGKALEIGAETKAEEIHNVTFRNCDIIHLTGNALDCMNVDYADVHDIAFKNINIECDETIPCPVLQKNDGEKYENPDTEYMPTTISVTVVFHHEYSKGSENRRGKNRNILFENIHVFGDKLPIIECCGYDEEHMTENVLISGLYLNGKPITQLDGSNWNVGEFTKDISLVADPYAQMAKNTVSAQGQLAPSSCIKFDSPCGKGVRVMFVGNSMTLHGIRPEIGWYNEWGMAASSKESDYVHLLKKNIRKTCAEAAFCVCQVSKWEMNYKKAGDILPQYETASNFGADLIILRLIENVPLDGYDPDVFVHELDRLINFLNKTGKAKIIITTGFWKHPGDGDIRAYAKERNITCVELGDLGERDEMKAIGLFADPGVENHPGDLGMQMIAERIFEALKNYI